MILLGASFSARMHPGDKGAVHGREEMRPAVSSDFNDGTAVPTAFLNEFKAELFVIAGGHTVAGTVKGEYRMKSGDNQVEDLLEIWVALEEKDIRSNGRSKS
jgi:hypothetical protein